MVAYANEGQLLFVDQDTQTPYIPTNLDDASITSGGQQIEPSQLEAGNVVLVTGDGIMLESYPATDTSAAGTSSSDNAQLPWSTDGKLASDIADARIPQQLEATATFSAKPDSVSVQRMPLIMADATADSADPGAHYIAGDEQAVENVDFKLVYGTPTFPIEPNYLYVLKVDFANGHVEYAFYTTT